METNTKPQGLEVKEGGTELYAQHEGKRKIFVHPYAGPNTFVSVRKQLSESGLRMPTMAETASLVDGAYNSINGKYSKEIIELMKKNWLWANNSVLWTPKGAYIEDCPRIDKNAVYWMNEYDLRERLKSGDKKVRFVPYGFNLGVQKQSELERNAFIIAMAGEEGAEKLTRVANKHPNKEGCLWGSDSDNKKTFQRVCSLSLDWGDYWLLVDGDDLGFNKVGHAFGVSD